MTNISCSGGFVPTAADTALDARTIIENVGEMANINYPFIGMIVYVKEEGKLYVVKSLKDKTVMGIVTPNAQIDAYEALAAEVEFATADEVNAMLVELGLK